VYYAAVAGLTVYSEPSSSSKVVGELSLHEKVRRYKLQGGYAYVKADAGGLAGWVNNSRLLWRLPAEKSVPREPAVSEPAEPAVEAPQGAPAAPAEAEVPEPAPTPPNVPATEEKPRPRRSGPGLFDPY
jgi:hypothetical protein